MFKVISSAESKEIGIWDIEHVETGQIIAEINTFSGYGQSTKRLIVKGKKVATIKNHKDAIEKLEQFFIDIKSDIENVKTIISKHKSDMQLVVNECTKDIISKEIERLHKQIENLEQYNLI